MWWDAITAVLWQAWLKLIASSKIIFLANRLSDSPWYAQRQCKWWMFINDALESKTIPAYTTFLLLRMLMKCCSQKHYIPCKRALMDSNSNVVDPNSLIWILFLFELTPFLLLIANPLNIWSTSIVIIKRMVLAQLKAFGLIPFAFGAGFKTFPQPWTLFHHRIAHMVS